jgi:hypothetical protein
MDQKSTQFVLFGQGRGEPVILALGDGLGLADLKKKIAEVLGLAADASLGVIAGVDEDTDLNEGALKDLIKGDKPKHVYAGQCRQIAVTVSFNGVAKTDKVPPAVKVKKVLKWAIKEFGISASDAPKMELRTTETGKGLPGDYPIGTFVTGTECALKLYLVNKEIHNG